MTCECGVTVSGGEWHLRQHQRTKRHAAAMAGQTVAPPPVAPLQLVEPPQEPVRSTLHRMADVLRGKQPPEPTVASSFDGVMLDLGDNSPPVWPRNPVPVGGDGSARARPRAPRGRPSGAEDLTPLFATGLVLLTTFAIGGWAAPTADEANAIAVPLANIVARRIDLAAKLGRDASDTIALVVALLAYSFRVVPLATERVRGSLEQRQRERVSRDGVGRPAEPSHGEGPYGMASGQGNGQDTAYGTAADPFNALAKARSFGLGIFDGGTHLPSGDGPTVADR